MKHAKLIGKGDQKAPTGLDNVPIYEKVFCLGWLYTHS